MTVAPPKPLQSSDASGDIAAEALIKEARRRARRRRWLSGGAVGLVVAIAVFTVPGSPSPPHGEAPRAATQPAGPTPLGAPEVQGADAATTLLTSYAYFRHGYAYIYADGRVIWQADATYTAGAPYARTRRLNAAGLNLIWSGELTAEDVVDGAVPSEAWADADDVGWAASEHAACLWQESENLYENDEMMYATGPFRDATHRLGDLSPAAQAILNGRPQRMFSGDGFQPASECFILTPLEARAALDLNGPNPWGLNEGPGFLHMIPPDAPADHGAIDLVVHQLLPHGSMLIWGA